MKFLSDATKQLSLQSMIQAWQFFRLHDTRASFISNLHIGSTIKNLSARIDVDPFRFSMANRPINFRWPLLRLMQFVNPRWSLVAHYGVTLWRDDSVWGPKRKTSQHANFNIEAYWNILIFRFHTEQLVAIGLGTRPGVGTPSNPTCHWEAPLWPKGFETKKSQI